jgi:oligoribonuclease
MRVDGNEPAHRLIWIDLEMTGLDPDHDDILEIATLVTDGDLNELAVGPVLAISTPLERLQAMDEWNRSHHGRSGLWQRALESGVSLATAEQQTLDFLKTWIGERVSPMCGNSICQDRRFLHRQMPMLEGFFHYRNLDVSTLKELARRWAPKVFSGLVKTGQHQALEDVRESVQELQYYRQFMGELGGALTR